MADSERETQASEALNHVWKRQRGWSIGADAAKSRVERARAGNLMLVVGAALLGALAAQPDWLSSGFQRGLSIVAGLALLVAGFVQSEYLTAAKVKAWTGARGASETLKAMVYAQLAGVELDDGPDQGTNATALLDWLTTVESRAFALGAVYGEPDGKPLPNVSGVADYRTMRAEDQGQWHANRHRDHDRRAKRLRAAQLALTAAGSLLAFLAGVAALPGVDAWVAAVAAMGAAVAAHLAAGQYDRIAESYQITASLLEREVVRFDALQADSANSANSTDADADSDAELARSLVRRTEEILARQNEGWVDMIQQATESK